MGVHYEIRLKDDNGFTRVIHSTDPAVIGSRAGLSIGPDDIHIMSRSQYDAADA